MHLKPLARRCLHCHIVRLCVVLVICPGIISRVTYQRMGKKHKNKFKGRHLPNTNNEDDDAASSVGTNDEISVDPPPGASVPPHAMHARTDTPQNRCYILASVTERLVAAAAADRCVGSSSGVHDTNEVANRVVLKAVECDGNSSLCSPMLGGCVIVQHAAQVHAEPKCTSPATDNLMSVVVKQGYHVVRNALPPPALENERLIWETVNHISRHYRPMFAERSTPAWSSLADKPMPIRQRHMPIIPPPERIPDAPHSYIQFVDNKNTTAARSDADVFYGGAHDYVQYTADKDPAVEVASVENMVTEIRVQAMFGRRDGRHATNTTNTLVIPIAPIKSTTVEVSKEIESRLTTKLAGINRTHLRPSSGRDTSTMLRSNPYFVCAIPEWRPSVNFVSSPATNDMAIQRNRLQNNKNVRTCALLKRSRSQPRTAVPLTGSNTKSKTKCFSTDEATQTEDDDDQPTLQRSSLSRSRSASRASVTFSVPTDSISYDSPKMAAPNYNLSDQRSVMQWASNMPSPRRTAAKPNLSSSPQSIVIEPDNEENVILHITHASEAIKRQLQYVCV